MQKTNEDSAFGPGMMFGIPGPGPKADRKPIPSDPKIEKGIDIKRKRKMKNLQSFEDFINESLNEATKVETLLNKIKVIYPIPSDVKTTVSSNGGYFVGGYSDNTLNRKLILLEHRSYLVVGRGLNEMVKFPPGTVFSGYEVSNHGGLGGTVLYLEGLKGYKVYMQKHNVYDDADVFGYLK